ncbi:MAG: type IV pilus assembly protein PilA [Cognaticolwellia sp.]|jgi:type IV pilus assembly protein PilA
MFKKGFTLVELMIVVAIIGILAAIAIPNFIEMQYRAKRSEVPSNVKGIKTSEMGYDAAFDTFLTATQHPSTTASKVQQNWTGGNLEFQKLGWAPDGQVRGQYGVATTTASSTPGGDFLVTGVCDVDGDSTTAQYTATKSVNATVNTANDVY